MLSRNIGVSSFSAEVAMEAALAALDAGISVVSFTSCEVFCR